MAFIPQQVWLDGSGNNLIQANSDGTYPIYSLQLGSGLTASWSKNGAQGLLTLTAASLGTFIHLAPIAAPATPASGWNAFSDSGASNRVEWQNPSGVVLAFGATSVTFGSSVASPTIGQDPMPLTGAANGQPLTWKAQAGQTQSGGADNNDGGDAVWSGGDPGTGGSGAAGVQGRALMKGGGLTATLSALGFAFPFATNYQPVTAPAAPASGWAVWTDTDGLLKAKNAAGEVGNMVPTIIVSNTKTMNASNTTEDVAVFQVNGTVRIVKFYALVGTQFGANHTGDKFYQDDGVSPVDIAPACATDMSHAPPGSMLTVSALSGSLETLGEPVGTDAALAISAGKSAFQEFKISAKSSGTTNIKHQYMTTDAPTSGVLLYFCEYEPINGGSVVAV